MKNFIKSLSISLLMSGSFVTHAMEKDVELEKGIAASLGLTLSDYRDSLEAEQQTFGIQKPAQQEKQRNDQLARERLRKEEQRNEQLLQEMLDREARESQRQSDVQWNERLRQEMLDREMKERQQRQVERDEQLVREMVARENQDAQRRQESARAMPMPIHQSHMERQSFVGQVNGISQYLALGKNRPLLENFMRIFGDLKVVAQHSNVHDLDNYVYKSENNIRFLIEIGDLYKIDNPDLTLAQIGQQMIQFMNDHIGLFKNYKYLEEPKTPEQIISIFDGYFSNMGAQVANMCPPAREIWSRAWTLALKLYTQNKDSDAIKIIFDQVIEGPATRGGCPEGLIDRGFVGYVILLGRAGVGIH